MNYKKIINEYLIQRYNYLLGCATNILNRNKNLEPTDLVSELVLYLNDNKEKVTEYIEMDKLEAFCVSWMNIQGRYFTSPINKKYASKAGTLDDYMSKTLISEPSKDFDIDKNDYEKDLIEIYSDAQIEKIMLVDGILDSLTEVEIILFKAYFVENLSYDKICKKYTFFKTKNNKKILYKSKKSIYNMMKELKEKINKLIDGNI